MSKNVPVAIIPRTMIRDQRLSDGALRVYLLLQEFWINSKRCWPSIRTIQDGLGKGRTTVCRHLRELEELGLIARDPKAGKSTSYVRVGTSSVRFTKRIPTKWGVETRSVSKNGTRSVSETDRVEPSPNSDHHPVRIQTTPQSEFGPGCFPLKGETEGVEGKEKKGRSSRGAAPAKGTGKGDGDHKRFVSWFCDEEWPRHHDVPYDFQGGKDGKIVKDLIRKFGLDGAKEICQEAFNDQWFVDKGISLQLILASSNSLRSRRHRTDRRAGVKNQADLRERLRSKTIFVCELCNGGCKVCRAKFSRRLREEGLS